MVLEIKKLTFGYKKNNFIFENFDLELKKGELMRNMLMSTYYLFFCDALTDQLDKDVSLPTFGIFFN